MNLVCSAFGRDAAHHEDLQQLYLYPNDLGVVQGVMLLVMILALALDEH